MLNGKDATLPEIESEVHHFLRTYKDADGLRFGDVSDYHPYEGAVLVIIRNPVTIDGNGVTNERRLWLLRFIMAMRGWLMDYMTPTQVVIQPLNSGGVV